jgi:hypothetical protein
VSSFRVSSSYAAFQEAAERLNALKDLLALSGVCGAERFRQGIEFQGRPRVAHVLADVVGYDDVRQAPISGARLALHEASLREAIHDPGNGAVGEPQLLGQFLQADGARPEDNGHGALLGAGQTSAGDFSLNRPPEDLAHGPKVAIDFRRNGGKLLLRHKILRL